MRREGIGRDMAPALAALILLAGVIGYGSWRYVADPMLFYTPPTWRLEWGGDAERIKPYELSDADLLEFGHDQDWRNWLTWEPREKPWWEMDEPLWTLEASFQTCQRWIEGPRESVCY